MFQSLPIFAPEKMGMSKVGHLGVMQKSQRFHLI